jgi:hypothetical protein
MIALGVYVACVILVALIEFIMHHFDKDYKIGWFHIFIPGLNTMYLIALCLCIPAAIINAIFPGNRDDG